MNYESINLPVPNISTQDKRAIPEFLAEEERAALRILDPEVKRPVRPMYSFVRVQTPDISPRQVSPGTKIWEELRYLATGELNFAQWSEAMEVDGTEHSLTIHSVHGAIDSKEYSYRILRCNCCLPDYRDASDVDSEYQPCAGKEAIIDARTLVFRGLLGAEVSGTRFRGESLKKATSFLIELVKNNPRAWAPTDRSNRILIDKLAKVFDVDTEEMAGVASELQDDNVVHLRSGKHPSIDIAA